MQRKPSNRKSLDKMEEIVIVPGEPTALIHSSTNQHEDELPGTVVLDLAQELNFAWSEEVAEKLKEAVETLRRNSESYYWTIRSFFAPPEVSLVYNRIAGERSDDCRAQSQAYANASDDYIQLGMPQEGLICCEKSAGIMPLPQTYTNMASCLVLMGDPVKANRILDEGLRKGGEIGRVIRQVALANEPLAKTHIGRDIIETAKSRFSYANTPPNYSVS